MVTKFLNIDTDNTLSANSNERVPSQKAVKSYTDTLATPKQDKVLTTPIEIDSDEETTVEGALGAISTNLAEKQDQSLSSVITVDGTQQTTVEGALNAINIVAGSAVQPSDLATVATTGSYNDLINQPIIPAAQVQSDWDESDESDVAYIKNKPYIPSEVIVDQSYNASSTNAQSGTAVAQAISTKQDTLTAGDNITITGTTISADVPNNVYTSDNLIAGTNISFDTISRTNRTSSNFSTSNYLKTAVFNPGSSTWEVSIGFKLNQALSTGDEGTLWSDTTISGDYNGLPNAFEVGIQPTKLFVALSTRSGWSNIGNLYYNNSFSANIVYKIIIKFTGSTYELYLGEDGSTPQLVDSLNSTSNIGSFRPSTAYNLLGVTDRYDGSGNYSIRVPFTYGEIILSDFNIKVAGTTVLDGSTYNFTKVGNVVVNEPIQATQVNNTLNYVAGTGISITEDSDENLVISNTQTSAEWGNISGTLSNQTDLQNALNAKQDTLVSGTNIKTVNGNSLLGSGNVDIDALPSQTGQSGKFLTTDGTDASWANVDALPSQTGQSGKFLTTDGSAASWAEIPTEVDNKSVTLNSNDEIQTVGVIDQNNPTKAIKKWTGTRAAYDAIVTKDPDTEYTTTDENETVYQNSYRIGQVLPSILPISDYGLHLLDGAVIDGTGIYSSFYSYIAGLVSTYPNLFISEADWQTAVMTYGVCGKFVYDSTNQTIRLPKITGIIEGTTDVTALGDLVQAGLPNITGYTNLDSNTSPTYVGGAFKSQSSSGNYTASGVSGVNKLLFDASGSSSIYGNSNTVQPQTIKVYYYIVIANSYQTPTGVQISKVATDLNGKVNLNSSWGMPSNTYIDVAVGASDSYYTAIADGYFLVNARITSAGGWFCLRRPANGFMGFEVHNPYVDSVTSGFLPVKKGDEVCLSYAGISFNDFRFIYAQKDNN